MITEREVPKVVSMVSETAVPLFNKFGGFVLDDFAPKLEPKLEAKLEPPVRCGLFLSKPGRGGKPRGGMVAAGRPSAISLSDNVTDFLVF